MSNVDSKGISLIDDGVGLRIEALEKSGQMENTIIAFNSDLAFDRVPEATTSLSL